VYYDAPAPVYPAPTAAATLGGAIAGAAIGRCRPVTVGRARSCRSVLGAFVGNGASRARDSVHASPESPLRAAFFFGVQARRTFEPYNGAMFSEPPYAGLTPDTVLDSLASAGFAATGACSR